MKKLWFIFLSFLLNNQSFSSSYTFKKNEKNLLKKLEREGIVKTVKSLNSSKTTGGGNVGPKIEK